MRDSYLFRNTSPEAQEYETPSMEESFKHSQDVRPETMS